MTGVRRKRYDFPNCGLDAVGVVGERLLGYGCSREKKKVAGCAKRSSKQQMFDFLMIEPWVVVAICILAVPYAIYLYIRMIFY